MDVCGYSKRRRCMCKRYCFNLIGLPQESSGWKQDNNIASGNGGQKRRNTGKYMIPGWWLYLRKGGTWGVLIELRRKGRATKINIQNHPVSDGGMPMTHDMGKEQQKMIMRRCISGGWEEKWLHWTIEKFTYYIEAWNIIILLLFSNFKVSMPGRSSWRIPPYLGSPLRLYSLSRLRLFCTSLEVHLLVGTYNDCL